jgi:hypothetical protein
LPHPFHSCLPTTMCFIHPRKFPQLAVVSKEPTQVNKLKNTQHIYENLPTFINLVNKGYKCVHYIQRLRATQLRLPNLFIDKDM